MYIKGLTNIFTDITRTSYWQKYCPTVFIYENKQQIIGAVQSVIECQQALKERNQLQPFNIILDSAVYNIGVLPQIPLNLDITVYHCKEIHALELPQFATEMAQKNFFHKGGGNL